MLFYRPNADLSSLVPHRVKHLTRLTLTLLITQCAIPFGLAQAQEQTPVEGELDFAVEKLEMQWSPGERYNGLNGTLNYAQTDLYLPGNGKLPIEIMRQFGQRRAGGAFNPIGTFGYMGLSIPSVSYTQESGDVFCASNGTPRSTEVLKSPLTFRHGETQKIFFGGSFGSAYVSSDGWIMECVPSTKSIPYSFNVLGDLKVKRPDGVEYTMRHVYSGGSATSASFRVVEMSDPYGNTLTYNYSATTIPTSAVRYGIVKLDSIVASDGRSVSISYANDSDPIRVTVGNEQYSTYRIDTIESNSSSNPIKLKYSYPDSNTLKITKNDTALTTINLSGGNINSITYPTGGTINYTYRDVLSSAGTNYRTLKTRTTSDGAVYDFSYTDNGDNTIVRRIKTPSAWIDYTYAKPVRANTSTGNVTNHTVESGRLINVKRYEAGLTGSPGNTLLSIDHTFENLSPSSVSIQAAQLIVPKKTTVKMNFGASSSNAASEFVRENVTFDQWGFPTQVIESSPGNISKTSTFEYQHDNFDRRILGKLITASRDGDTQRYTYNAQGDVATHSDNGITTTYEWHQSGDDKGELHTQTTALNHTTTFTDYKRGQAQRITNPANYSQNRTINDNATVASESRFKKFLAKSSGLPEIGYQYDSLRRLKRVEPERILSSDVNYLWLDNRTLDINDSNNTRFKKEERLDFFGRTKAKGTYDRDQYRWSSVKYDYDTQGRLLFVSYPQNVDPDSLANMNALAGTHYQYDAMDRITQVTNDENEGNATVVSYVYSSGEGGDLTIAEQDGRGSVTTTTYRSHGSPHYQWPIKIVDADGQVSTIDRNTITGRVNSFTRGGQTTSYTYDSNQLLDSLTQDENGTTTFDYYADGRLKSRTNQGRKVTFEYYSDGLLHKELYTDSDKEDVTRTFQYDQYQNLEYAITTSPSGSQNNTLYYTYDNDNNVKTQSLTVDGMQYVMQYEYDELSNVQSITYPNGRTYSLSPNSLGSPTSIQQIGGVGKSIYNLIQYNDNNTMKLMQRDGHQVKNELNSGQRPFKYRLEQYGNGNFAALGERQYEYDKAANIARIDDTVGSQYSDEGRYMSFTYDSRNRLTSENISNGDNWSYDYLPNDSINWIQQGSTRSTFEYNVANKRLSGVRTGNAHRQYGYDAQGNMTAHERLQGSAKVTRLLTYNAANQLVAMNDGTTYGYDARGLRVKQERNGSIHTLYDPSERLVYRYDHQAQVSSEYFYVNGKLVARRDEDKSGNQNDDPTNDDDSGSDNGSNDVTSITVSGRTISWPDDGWYQVQSEDGLTNVCEGGTSCTVPSDGTYIVINHTTGTRTPTVVGEATGDDNTDSGGSGGSTDTGSTGPTQITVTGRTITWPSDGWYQVQTEDGSTNVCSGGTSCTVAADGTYIVINHTTGTRTPTVVGSTNTDSGGSGDTDSGDTGGSSNTGSSGVSTDISVSGKTISWPDNGWYQVQTEDGSSNVCEGGTSCTVSSDGTYIVINHTLNQRTNVVVNTASTAPAEPEGITVSGRTISWPDDGWYQVQTADGSSSLCQGGRSCGVPADGSYIVINHTTGVRTTVEVGSGSTDSSGITVSGRTISWPDDGWYQVQTEDGNTNVCEGGRTCSVPTAGSYIVINHTTGTRTTVATN